jgi:hypothetical protein
MLRRMQGTLRMAHLVVGAIAVVAFLITGMLMSGHEPPVVELGWGERLLFSSRHVYLMCGGLLNIALGVHYGLPERVARRGAAVIGSVLVLISTVLLFFAFFAEPMAGRWPGYLSNLGLFALFWGVLIYASVSLRQTGRIA